MFDPSIMTEYNKSNIVHSTSSHLNFLWSFFFRKEELRFSEGAHEATKFDVMASSEGDERPKYTYKQLISLALKSNPEEGCTLPGMPTLSYFFAVDLSC